jgi:hypothetical protein
VQKPFVGDWNEKAFNPCPPSVQSTVSSPGIASPIVAQGIIRRIIAEIKLRGSFAEV